MRSGLINGKTENKCHRKNPWDVTFCERGREEEEQRRRRPNDIWA